MEDLHNPRATPLARRWSRRDILNQQQANLGLTLSTKRTRKRDFLGQMECVVPWAELDALIERHAPKRKTGRPPFALQTVLRIHCLEQWFTLWDPAMEEAQFGVPLFREFAQLSWEQRPPYETTILRFRQLLEPHKLALVNQVLPGKGLMLKTGSVVHAEPNSTRNAAQLKTLFALANLWLAREKLLVLDGQVCLKTA